MDRITQRVVSYDLGRNVLFDKIGYGENFLILYSNTDAHKQILRNLIKQNKDDSILFYVSHKENESNFGFDIRNFSFNIINEDVIYELKKQLSKCFDEMEKNNRKMLLISDWSNADLSKYEVFLPFLENLIKRSQGLSPPGWRRKYKEMRHKTPFMMVNAFETTNLNDGFIQQIIQLHQRVYLLQENLNTFLLPTTSPSLETVFPKSHVLPQELLEKLVKDNLELITLLFLEKLPQSGYQVLKNIAQHFHCILSQGTLYPLLYELEKKNEIKKQNGKGREIIYSLTPEAKKELQSKKETQLRTYQHLASFFESGGGGEKKIGLFKPK